MKINFWAREKGMNLNPHLRRALYHYSSDRRTSPDGLEPQQSA